MKVLLLGSYPLLLRALEKALHEEGYTIDVADCGPDGDARVATADHDAIVLDLPRPGEVGLSRLRGWRHAGLKVRVLVLGDPGVSDDPAADDCLSKPFALEEFLSRLRALIPPP